MTLDEYRAANPPPTLADFGGNAIAFTQAITQYTQQMRSSVDDRSQQELDHKYEQQRANQDAEWWNPLDDTAGAFQGSAPIQGGSGEGFASDVYNNFSEGTGEQFLAGYGNQAQQELQGIQQGALDTGTSLAQQSAAAGYNYGDAQAAAGQQYGAAVAGAGAAAQQQLGLLGHQLYDAQTGVGNAAAQYGLGQAANIGGISQAGAANLGAMGADMYGQGQAAAGRNVTSYDPNAGGMWRQNASEAAGQLGGLERTEGPSAAQAQLQSGLNQAQSSNLAMARSGRGWGGGASSLSQAAVQNAQAGQQAANQSAALRAQETAAWRQRQAANLQANAGVNMGLSQQAMQGQVNQNQIALQQQQQNDAAQQALYSGALQGAGQSAQVGLQGAQAAAGIGQQAYGQQLGAYQGAGQAAMAGIQAGHEANMGGLQAGGSMALQGLGQGAGTTLSGLGQGGAQYAQGQQTALAAEGMQGQIEGAYQQYEQQETQNYLQAAGMEQGVALQNAQMGNALVGASIGAAGSLLGSAAKLSDATTKTGIAPADDAMLDLLDKAPAFGWEYSDPTEPGAGEGRFFGQMAQDLEKSEVGASLVKDAPTGRKMVDGVRAGLVALGSVAAVKRSFQSQIEELEKKIAALSRGKKAA